MRALRARVPACLACLFIGVPFYWRAFFSACLFLACLSFWRAFFLACLFFGVPFHFFGVPFFGVPFFWRAFFLACLFFGVPFQFFGVPFFGVLSFWRAISFFRRALLEISYNDSSCWNRNLPRMCLGREKNLLKLGPGTQAPGQ